MEFMDATIGRWVRPDEGARLDERRITLMRKTSESGRLVMESGEELAFGDEASARAAAQGLTLAAARLRALVAEIGSLAADIDAAERAGTAGARLRLEPIGGAS